MEDDIQYCKDGILFPINLDDIPVLSKEKDFSHLETPTLQHGALRIDMLEKIFPYISERVNLSETLNLSMNLNDFKIFAEFGVYKGETAKKILEINKHFVAHLFDSFEGLPEDWDEWFKKGYFALNEEEIPVFNSFSNVTIHKGYFEKTVPVFAEYLKEENNFLDFIHIDCDLYSSTKTIFDHLNPFIKSGTIIHFDELIGVNTWYKDWKNGEYKALLEWAINNKRSFEYLCRTDYTQVTIKVL